MWCRVCDLTGIITPHIYVPYSDYHCFGSDFGGGGNIVGQNPQVRMAWLGGLPLAVGFIMQYGQSATQPGTPPNGWVGMIMQLI